LNKDHEKEEKRGRVQEFAGHKGQHNADFLSEKDER